ncbi:MAG TPA: hypothetical protein VM487_01150 [Phycisphaerae bacterium]|nr:hypothetical protein [Phycisphaerae bacterium]
MEGLVLLLLLALGMGGNRGTGNGGTGNGGSKKGPARPGSVPSGDPPGGCRLAYTSPAATVQGLNMLGYTPIAEIWGPDGQLGTFDAEVDSEVMQFQLDYNDASRTGFLGPNAGGLTPDGMVGKCLMAGMEHVVSHVGAAAWQDRYQARGLGGIGG